MKATANIAVEPASGIEPDDLHRLSLDVYRSMGELGLLIPDDRVVLLDGLLVKKMTKGPRQSTVTHWLFKRCDASLPAGWFARIEQPIELPAGPVGDSSPEPDVAVVAGTIEDYATRHPGPSELALVVEVASNSKALAGDRLGLGRYAWAGIPAAWIVNLTNNTVEVYTVPSGMQSNPRFVRCDVKTPGEIAAITIGKSVVGIQVDEIVR